MSSFFLFRSNLKHLEYYHQYTNLETFEKYCHDFYILQMIYYLRHNYIDHGIVWRLNPKDKNVDDITFNVNGRKLVQKFCNDFHESLRYKRPYVTFWRGGFPEYDKVTKKYKNFFNPNSLYLGAGRRVLPQYGGYYDKILVESEEDLKIPRKNIYPFYKTANPNIFYDKGIKNKKYDICLPANFKQMKMKGQDWFIDKISRSEFLKSLKIIIVGNDIDYGRKLTKKYNLNNVELINQLDRAGLNHLLNESKFGIVTSNELDGSPRVITEILSSGTPLLIRNKTRCLSYYKKYGCVEFGENDLEEKVKFSLDNYDNKKKEMENCLENLKFDIVCQMNWMNFVT